MMEIGDGGDAGLHGGPSRPLYASRFTSVWNWDGKKGGVGEENSICRDGLAGQEKKALIIYYFFLLG